MASCPYCRTEVAIEVKSWTVTPAKHKPTGYVPEFRVGIFECPRCKSKFRSKVDIIAKPTRKNLKELHAKITEIHEGLTQSLRILHLKIGTLETERANLLVEIEGLKKVAETRANALETEVNQLREELRSLREFLGAID